MIKPIVVYPDKRLRQENLPITDFGPATQALYRDLCDTMIVAGGAGISACQIGVNLQMFVVKVDYDKDSKDLPACFINPQITFVFDETETGEEGCLSFPGLWEDIARSKWIKIKFQDLQGQDHEITANGFLAKVIQHEYEHTLGKLFIDLMEPKTREQAKKHFTSMKLSGSKPGQKRR